MVIANRRYHAAAKKLVVLPPEVLHKVLDDLPLVKILEIFRTPESLSTLKQYFALYIELCQRKRGPASRHPEVIAFRQDAVCLVKQDEKSQDGLFNSLLVNIRAVVHLLLRPYEPYIPALAEYTPSIAGGMPDISDPFALKEYWTNLDAAELRLNKAKSLQLQRIAQLYKEYPGMLKRRLDTSQESRRLSDQHRIDALELSAKKILQPHILRGSFLAKAIFAEQQFPITPYDRHLKTFLRILEKYPCGQDVPTSLPLLVRRRPVKQYSWPTDVASDIKQVTDGMAYVYPKSSREGDENIRILRTKYTRYSDQAYSTSVGARQPRFLGGFNDVHEHKHSLYIRESDKILPLEEREFEWLEAFLRVCRFMSQMDDVEWRAGVSVKEFWNIHTGDLSIPAQAAGDDAK
ncbi:hypothetical protein H0H92_005034 [Tricholoma furcatifolium]|nr:hypothetical protein H0H92_005034 [Tricholoma furcatifolium]